MIVPLSLQNADVVEQLWHLQHIAYRLEAIALGLQEYPPLADTFDSIRNSTQSYYGWMDDQEELRGAIAVSDHRENQPPRTIKINRLMVHNDYLRQGIGRSLVQYIVNAYPDLDIEVIAGAQNIPAISLYQSFGFEQRESYVVESGVRLIRYLLERI
ncbi:ribosomal protein S18 acetylase RimI-like enzyme [Paenibacillus turicensis]|uniref:Ribosomal protein S18 acetylase RimI-like enzyme n=1 Tax=Paenibacillus turicensis TaxID=160487 RepID=A0ABS4FUW1_9BACL|nr:GNAT family N-acetyltransferase [Paenibacillus turicensis]MBP1906368.1 ribosomal protein S18 acetylase RimI-like enzyme [Paenibacillus turicensis]